MAWKVPAVIGCAFVAGYVLLHLPGSSIGNVSGDTTTLVHGARRIAYCLGHGIYSSCDRGTDTTTVGPFPLFQYFPALLFTQLGMGDIRVYAALTVISLVSFCAVVGLTAWAASLTGRRWAPAVAVLIVTTSPLVYYAWSTFGESFASALLVLMAVAAQRRWPPVVIALTAALACITKETVFPIVAVLGAVSLWATPIAGRRLRRGHWIGLASGLLLGIAAGAALNWLRYHHLTNTDYLGSQLQVPGVGRRLGLSVTLWLAPNGGTALFWPLATALIIGLIVIAIVGLTRRPVVWIKTLPAVACVLSALFMTGILASWYDPFGWYAWGPRLMLPPIPAICLVGLVIYSGEIERGLRRVFASPAWAVLATIVVIVIALPQVNVLGAGVVTSETFAPDKQCPNTPIIQTTTVSYYYGCYDHEAWGKHWILPDSYRALQRAWGAIFAVAFGGLWVWLLLVGTASLSAEDRRGGARETRSVLVGTPST